MNQHSITRRGKCPERCKREKLQKEPKTMLGYSTESACVLPTAHKTQNSSLTTQGSMVLL